MSKWGYVSSTDAKRKFENDPDFAAQMVYEMSTLVIKQEEEINSQKNKIIELQMQLGGALTSEAQLRGYMTVSRKLILSVNSVS